MESFPPTDLSSLVHALGRRSIVFVGLMGAGKSVIGRKVAFALDLPFVDSDHEIETVSRMTIADLFESFGEAEFRALESRVIARLLKTGPQVISTGGGAFVDPATRENVVASGISVWLKADLDTLMERVMKRQDRPLLKTADPRAVMRRLMDARYPLYAQADLTVQTRDIRKEVIADEVVNALRSRLLPHAADGSMDR